MKAIVRWSVFAFLCFSIPMAFLGCANQPGETQTFASIEFQWCPSGSFVMGSPEDEAGRSDNESPQHIVSLTHGFWMGKYEVTQAQWEALMDSNPSYYRGADLPVERVSWNDAQAFIDALNAEHPEMRFRLPTEAEWEYACRAGTSTRFYWGEDPDETEIDDYAWYEGNSGITNLTKPVGGKLPNPWGLYDMAGNVDEWCLDEYGDYPAGPVTDPLGEFLGQKILRGGRSDLQAIYCRSADRSFVEPENNLGFKGFRLLRAID